MEINKNSHPISLETIISELTIENDQLKNRVKELECQLKQFHSYVNYVNKNNQITDMLSTVSQEIKQKEASRIQNILKQTFHQNYQQQVNQEYKQQYEQPFDQELEYESKKRRKENYSTISPREILYHESSSHFEEVYTKKDLVFFLILENRRIPFNSDKDLIQGLFNYSNSTYNIKIILFNKQNQEIANTLFSINTNEKSQDDKFGRWLKDKIYNNIFLFMNKYSNIRYEYQLKDSDSATISSKEHFLDFLVNHHVKENQSEYFINITSYFLSKDLQKYKMKNISKLTIKIKGNYTLREWFKRGLDMHERKVLEDLHIL